MHALLRTHAHPWTHVLVLLQVKADGVSVDLALYRAGAADGVGPNDAAVRWICVRRLQKAACRRPPPAGWRVDGYWRIGLSGIGLSGIGLSGFGLSGIGSKWDRV